MHNKTIQNVPIAILNEISNLNLNIESDNCNQAVNSLLQRTVLSNGKRLRPLLLFLIGDLFNLPLETLRPYAKSIECVHGASLAHDDVIDNATTRRGQPSINIVSSNKRSVLAGDYLLAEVISELAIQGNLKVLKEMSSVIKQLTDGEWLQLDLAKSRDYSKSLIEQVALNKTASVLTWCCTAPALIAQVDDNIYELMKSFGRSLGLAFQLVDDALDFSSRSQKDNFLDIQNETLNSVLFEWLELNHDLKIKFMNGDSLESLISNHRLPEAITAIKLRAKSHIDNCREILSRIVLELKKVRKDHDNIDNKVLSLFAILTKIETREH